MTSKIRIYIYIAIAVIIAGFVAYHFYIVNDLKNQVDEWKLEANKQGIALRISDSLWKYTAYINEKKMDSIISSNKDICALIKKGQEKPLIVTNTIERIYLEKIPADTTMQDPKDTTYRIATAKDKQGWYEFEAKYQIVKPWNFEFSKMLMHDKLTQVTTQLPNGRIAVYTKNVNPYVHLDSVETLIDPVMIKTPEIGPKWQWQMSGLVNPVNRETDLQFGIFAPMKLGAVVSYSVYKNNIFVPPPKEGFKIGLSFIKNF
ncbi:MAG: hypothetical protein PHN88_09110 [Ignavibacteria bacterium]|nr:hypothetical protein [Ignavibacteria bacterium]